MPRPSRYATCPLETGAAPGTESDLLLRNADIALYRAKRSGRGQYRCHSPDMNVELKATRSLEAGLRQALERGTLELFYQPLFALGDGSF
jgi:predicted signal transduction protein with EAL and GGDEF domain